MADNRKKTDMVFQEGLNDRVSQERRQQGFQRLENARLQERGNTLQVSRIDGYQQIAGDDTSFDVVYDSTVYDNDLVVYWYDTSSGEVVVTFIDLSGLGTTEKRFTSTQADYGELTLLENNIYLTPYDKQLNNIGGTWYLNDFISTTPTINVGGVYSGSIQVLDGAGTDGFATGSIDITSTTSTAGSKATASITVDSSASSNETFDIDFYEDDLGNTQTVSVSVLSGDDASTIAQKIVNALQGNTVITDDWTIQRSGAGLNVVDIISDEVGNEWNGYSIGFGATVFSYTLDSPTSGGIDNVLTLSFPEQPSNTVLTDTIATSDSTNDIAQKISNAINNKTGLDYTATQNGTTVDIQADNLGKQYNGTFGVTQEGLDFTYDKNNFTGGYKATGNFFTISFGIAIPDIDTQTFSSGDSNTQLVQYIYDALTGDSDFNNNYDAFIDGDTVTITGDTQSTVTVTEDITANNTTTNVSGVGTTGKLDQQADYWYKARYVYYDGHKTLTCYPELVNTENTRQVQVEIEVDETDLDGNVPDIEIFRKKEGSDFFLIERVTPSSTGTYFYEDDGKPNVSPLDERSYVWAGSPVTQDIVRDRLVRANLVYADKDFSTNHSVSGVSSSDDSSVPDQTSVFVYAKGRFDDGTESFHKQIGSFESNDTETIIQIDQTGGFDSDLKEVGFYSQYNFPNPVESDFITFNSLEIYNTNVPSIATESESEADQDRPIAPHIFVGFKHFVRDVTDNGDGTYDLNDIIVDIDWDSDTAGSDTGANSRYNFQTQTISSTNETDLFPIYVDVTLVSGRTITYKKKIRNNISPNGMAVYEIAWIEGLQEYIRNGECNFYLNSIDNEYTLSSEQATQTYQDNIVQIVGTEDYSLKHDDDFLFGDVANTVNPNPTNRFYLLAETDSIYADFDAIDFNNSGVVVDWRNETPDLTYRANFNIDNSKYVKDNAPTSSTITRNGFDYQLYEYDDEVIQQEPEQDLESTAIFIGSQREDYSGTDQYQTGLEKITQNGFTFWSLKESNIYEELITKDDLEQFQENYPNQLVWGGSYILESNASGTRDFEFTNFKNISQNYGEIVAISYINNILLVFCERGVNRVNVGEVLTQQTDSQVFVDSSALLNNDVWILKNVPDIKPRSITQYENMLFFSDGKDVWQFTDGLQNISNGKITLDIDQKFEGTVDPKNKEYQLTNGDETWVYSIELQQWQGPFTYKIETASPYRDNFYGVVGSDSVEFNSGNDFDGSSYDTVIESVANTLDDASVTKLFRKFYIETEGDATFSYGKEYGTWTDKTLSNYPNKNGVYHIGVNPANKNGRQLYWKVTTQEQDFVLQLISFLWQARKRR